MIFVLFSYLSYFYSAGVGRTGVFIGLCNLIERVRVEGYVDVFQVVREMRTQRPAMVQTKVRYSCKQIWVLNMKRFIAFEGKNLVKGF